MASSGNIMFNLKQKMQSLRDELEKYRDLYEEKSREFEREKNRRVDAENEIVSLMRRIEVLEDEKDQAESRHSQVIHKLTDASKVVDEYERVQRVNSSRQNHDEEKMTALEEQIRMLKATTDLAEKKYDDAVRRLHLMEAELEKAEERSDVAESKVRQLDSSLHVLSNNMKSLEISEQTLASKEETYENTIANLSKKLKESEHMVDLLSRELRCKDSELERTEKSLYEMQSEYKQLREEMDACYKDLVCL